MNCRNKYYLSKVIKTKLYGGSYECTYSNGLDELIRYFSFDDEKNIPLSIDIDEEED